MTRRVPFVLGLRLWTETPAQIQSRLEAHLLRLRARRGPRTPQPLDWLDHPDLGRTIPAATRSVDVDPALLEAVAAEERTIRDMASLHGLERSDARELAVDVVAKRTARARAEEAVPDGSTADGQAARRAVASRLFAELRAALGAACLGIEPDDPPETESENAAGAPELTFRDRDKLRRRADRLHRARQKATGLPASVREEDRKALLARAEGVRLAGPRDAHAADEIAARLLDEMSWMREPLRLVWHASRRAAGQGRGLALPPLLLVGPPGVGKSHLARRLAEEAGTPFVSIDLGAGCEGFRVAGVSKGWASAQAGAPVETILASGVGNPVILVDELDKGGVWESTRGQRTSAWDALLGLLEPGTAARWTCPYYGMPFDMSHVVWVLAANTTKGIPAPLLSRCRIVRVERPGPDDLARVAAREAARLGLGDEAAEALVCQVRSGPPGLDLRAVLRLARRLADREALPPLH